MKRSNWLTVDAKGEQFGRLASKLAFILQGKDQPDWQPHLNQAPHIVVTNCAKMKVGLRLADRNYFSHSGYLGNLRTKKFTDQTNSERLLSAVSHMLPDNKLRRSILKNLHCFETENHPHKPQTDHE